MCDIWQCCISLLRPLLRIVFSSFFPRLWSRCETIHENCRSAKINEQKIGCHTFHLNFNRDLSWSGNKIRFGVLILCLNVCVCARVYFVWFLSFLCFVCEQRIYPCPELLRELIKSPTTAPNMLNLIWFKIKRRLGEFVLFFI